MKRSFAFLLLGVALSTPGAPPPAPSPASVAPPALRQEIAQFVAAAQPVLPQGAPPVAPVEWARTSFAADGYLRYLGAPPQHHFAPPAKGVADPAALARDFLIRHGRFFGVTSPAVDYVPIHVRSGNGRHFVRLEQHYAGLPLFAAQAIVQVNAQGGVESVLSDVERDVRALDENALSLTPHIPDQEAARRARRWVSGKPDPAGWQATPPELKLFGPSVVGESGGLRLVWEMEVSSPDLLVCDRVLVDAHSGELVRQYALNHTALDRQICDSNNTTNRTCDVSRSEGDPLLGIIDLDHAYNIYGDVYNFYWDYHGRDSINDGGMVILAYVRYCDSSVSTCPWNNAMWLWGLQGMIVGEGLVVDDILGHEFTHGVIAYSSQLIYANASGAINESFCDLWGEFVDQTNGRGTDTEAVRWQLGEDGPGGRMRDLRDPPSCNQPDRLSSPLYYTGTNDHGGVHNNSGVNNKLIYLLTDGDSFNGQTTYGMGLHSVVDLYYEVNVNLIPPGADWVDLYNALQQAAVNLGWSTRARNNLHRGCLAVEINGSGQDHYVDWRNTCPFPNGTVSCSSGQGGPYPTVRQGVDAACPGDTLLIRNGSYNEQSTLTKILHLRSYDGPVTIGR